jgi:hypothetical protein
VKFFLFPRLKSIMKGARFVDMAAIQERVTAVLQSIPKEAYADSFQKLYERCQQCVVKDGDYFEGEESYFVCIFCLVCFLVPFTEIFRHTTYIFLIAALSTYNLQGAETKMCSKDKTINRLR